MHSRTHPKIVRPHRMAFPFPGYPNAPQTPQHFPIAESPSMPRKSNPNAAYKRTALAVAIVFTISLWMMGPWFGSPNRLDNVPFSLNAVEDHFAHFEGHQDCGIMSSDLYTPPTLFEDTGSAHKLYCSNRATLLEAMSGGGRHGFERPYFPVGCHYRWYSTAEICMILERLDAIIFIGDDTLKHIYASFNILLRENLAIGGLKQWEITETDRVLCRCENQFTRPECSAHMLTDSQAVADNDASSGHRSPYYCNRTPHMFFPIKDSPAPEELRSRFTSILGQDPDAYKPIPVIHSLSLSTSLSWATATSSMDEWVSLADASGRNVPFLWIGPNATGHLKPPGQIMSQGNNALWHYTIEMEKEAKSRELDALGMYNLTLQANSWDGNYYGQRVGLVQAMMIINWLSRVDST